MPGLVLHLKRFVVNTWSVGFSNQGLQCKLGQAEAGRSIQDGLLGNLLQPQWCSNPCFQSTVLATVSLNNQLTAHPQRHCCRRRLNAGHYSFAVSVESCERIANNKACSIPDRTRCLVLTYTCILWVAVPQNLAKGVCDIDACMFVPHLRSPDLKTLMQRLALLGQQTLVYFTTWPQVQSRHICPVVAHIHQDHHCCMFGCFASVAKVLRHCSDITVMHDRCTVKLMQCPLLLDFLTADCSKNPEME